MVDTSLAAVCGLYCGNCEHLETKCQGCGQQKGKPFWTKLMNVEACPLYNCCVNTKQLEHCGLCSELPCQTFNELRDPSLSDEEAQKALVARRNELVQRKKVGTENWLKQKQAKD
ncbi:MAG: DUF3795 domain-containing protein [Candidatus Bathyarchaeota archaeon]|nr:DUF3795 domain-containing protein [Candidatus Bathyarchaeota archaeon]